MATHAPAPGDPAQRRNPLHGVTLLAMLQALVDHFGWDELGTRLPIRCFTHEPSLPSSLKFLRRTPWARLKVEALYLSMRRQEVRGRSPRRAVAPAVMAFGSWTSPITAELIAGAAIRLGQPAVLDGDIFWTEGRPQEGGRNVLVRCDAHHALTELTPAPLNVRSRVHEYGGGAYVVGPRAAFFVNNADQQIWRVRPREAPQPLTHTEGVRHADLVIDAPRKRLICVREDHRGGPEAIANELVAVDLAHGETTVLHRGSDFCSSPQLNPLATHLAWLTWDHPDMPWDASRLWCAALLEDGGLGPPVAVAGGAQESIFQPSWSPQGELHFVSDCSGWWNLYRWRDAVVQALHPMAADFGTAQWVFGMSTYGFDAGGRIVCTYTDGQRSHLAVLDTGSGSFDLIETDYQKISDVHVGADAAVFIAERSDAPAAVVRLDLRNGALHTLRTSSSAPLDRSLVSVAQPIQFETTWGEQAHAYHYPPTNPQCCGADGERPPLLVLNHGGPTHRTDAGFQWSIQYWTSRGFAVVDVNHRGSTGFGRAYRQRLRGQWGVFDVEDGIAAARHLIERGLADAGRVAIRGASAGGYTTLSALTFHDFYQAGASHYGIGDLEAIARDTHKFESRYLDGLIGPYPQARALYVARSPVHHTDRLSSPMILFQGAQDRAVPPAQAQAMFDAVLAKGLPVALLMFEGEEHGFRRAENIRRALEAELYFYGKVFGFTPAQAIEPVDIRNLPTAAA